MAKLKRVKRAARKPWKQITGKAKKKTKRGIHYCLAFNNPSVLYFNEAFFCFSQIIQQLRSAWDHKKTLRQNYAALGLASDPNMTRDLRPSHAPQVAKMDFEEVIITPEEQLKSLNEEPKPMEEDSNNVDKKQASSKKSKKGTHAELLKLAAQPELKAPKRMPYGDKVYLSQCILKHGTDYEAMARDIKVNFNQLTPAQLKRKCELCMPSVL